MASNAKTAVIIGMGDGSLSHELANCGRYGRLLTVRLPGEAEVAVPGGVFDANQHDPGAFVRDGWRDHHQMVSLATTDFFDRHPVSVSEDVRAQFAVPCYQMLMGKPADFGDDILDGMQGAFHVAHTAKWILRGPHARDLPKFTCPVIAIGSGPSLSRHIPALRALQNKCILVASNSALDGLLDNGITPHFATPMERDELCVKLCKRESYPGVIFAGKGVVHPDVARRFNRHMWCPCTDVLYVWSGAQEDDLYFYGMSTGSMAVALATQLSAGTVYLAGHDLAYDAEKAHWSGSNAMPPDTCDVMVLGHSGPIRSNAFWNRLRGQIEIQTMAHEARGLDVINLNTLDGIGAKIASTKSGSLPQPADLPDLVFPQWPEPNEGRIVAFRQKLHRLPSDVSKALAKLSTTRPTRDDVDLAKLFDGSPNMQMLAYVLRSMLGQFSYETYSSRPVSVVCQAMAEAMRSVLTQLMPMFEEMAHAADD